MTYQLDGSAKQTSWKDQPDGPTKVVVVGVGLGLLKFSEISCTLQDISGFERCVILFWFDQTNK